MRCPGRVRSGFRDLSAPCPLEARPLRSFLRLGRRKGIATLEIDLSGIARNASRGEVAEAVLAKAPRAWVYHPRIDAEVAAMKKTVRVERLVADEGQAIDASHRSIEARDVVAMARQQHEADQIAERIYDGGDLRRPTAARIGYRARH
jgi:hypothetical protein